MAKYFVSMQGIGAKCLTAKKGTAATPGWPCHFTANNTVSDAANDGAFSGVVTGVRGDLVTVQYRGFITLPFSGSTPAVGYAALVADGTGGVKTAKSGINYLIASVDVTTKTVCVLL